MRNSKFKLNYFTYGISALITLISLFLVTYSLMEGVIYPRMLNYGNVASASFFAINDENSLRSGEVPIDNQNDLIDIYIAKYESQNTARTIVFNNTYNSSLIINAPNFIEYTFHNGVGRSKLAGDNQFVIYGSFTKSIEGKPYIIVVQKNLWRILYELTGFFLIIPVIASISFSSAYVINRIYNKQLELNINNENILNLIDSICIISSTDSDGNINYVNKKFAQISKYSEHELYGKNHRILNSKDGTNWAEMYSCTKHPSCIWHKQIRNKDKDGQFYYVDRAIAKKIEGGHLSIGYDISEIVIQQQELNKQFNILDRSAFQIRHDLLNPVNLLKQIFPIFLKKLNQQDRDKLGIDKTLNTIEKSLSQLFTIYDGIFDFTAMVRKGAKLNKTPENLHAILSNYFKNVAYGYAVEIDPNLPEIIINKGLFCNAIDNLVRNGMTYNDSNDKKVIVEYDAKHQAILIKDNGRGMTSEEFNKFNEPYMRGDNKETGSGLGLSIARIILEKHGFELDCLTTEPGHGTTMSIKLSNNEGN